MYDPQTHVKKAPNFTPILAGSVISTTGTLGEREREGGREGGRG